MTPARPKCQVCNSAEFKYRCSSCKILYCSVPCYKNHRSTACVGCSVEATQSPAQGVGYTKPYNGVLHVESPTDSLSLEPFASTSIAHDTVSSADRVFGNIEPLASDLPLLEPPSKPLRPLTSLEWPYIPEESSYVDPLQRDDPKPLTLAQYEALATSPAIRKALVSHPRLHDLLRALDRLEGQEREEELQLMLGISASDTQRNAERFGGSRNKKAHTLAVDDETMHAVAELAAAVEKAVRGERRDMLGLDWEDS